MKKLHQLTVELKGIDAIEMKSGISLISIYLTPASISVIILLSRIRGNSIL
ncbi:hypothetical protein [Terribacillus sp. DMT04]|uniref:hypothetical protein n=1 Tax=Terribacillus sp. DMT04 TaxID=2850441 RepID=UPI001C2C52F6|nr:hypothetical protein [Terribacillus sp. DMT04]QXE03286.1 hypothetical protein KS242_08995 [Terribacillus sp. DMT04]